MHSAKKLEMLKKQSYPDCMKNICISMRKRQSNCKAANVLKNILYKIGCLIGQAVYEKNTQGSFTHRNRKKWKF